MKLLVECSQKKELYLNTIDGVILPLENYSVESTTYFSMEEIRKIIEKSQCEVFIKINKNFMNE